MHVAKVGIVALLCLAAQAAGAGFFLAPGDARLLNDLRLLADGGHLAVPLTTWPQSRDAIQAGLAGVDVGELDALELAAHGRVRLVLERLSRSRHASYSVSGASKPSAIRGFDDEPREQGGIGIRGGLQGDRASVSVTATWVSDPQDGESLRPDGSHATVVAGNWLLTAGYQDRWWGPGLDGSLILSNNARPLPAVAIDRRLALRPKSRWLRWIGPWTLSAFMGQLNDERAIDDALLFGMRIGFRPLDSLEIGFSRSAQWCGDGRPCGADTFGDLLLGRDNRGVNVDPDEEPGNQLAGFDARWRLPGESRTALYLQWIGEDTRQGGPLVGSWLRLLGAEKWGRLGNSQRRSFVEIAESSCRRGGLGMSGNNPDCAYEHGIYRDGYRFHGRAIGHSLDGDGLSYSIGSTLVQSAGQSWGLRLRYVELNRIGNPSVTHSLASTPSDGIDLQLSHRRNWGGGTLDIGVGWEHYGEAPSEIDGGGVNAFLRWSSHP